jgi:fructose-bisphosphate aldolase class II
MYDGSKFSFAENAANTKKIAEMAHACNIPVEAEIG